MCVTVMSVTVISVTAGQLSKHYLLRTIMPMDQRHANVSDVYFQRRWSVLRFVPGVCVCRGVCSVFSQRKWPALAHSLIGS